MRFAISVLGLALFVFACSTESPSDGTSSSSGGTSSSGDNPSNCSCSVTHNGDKETIACGDEACVGGASYQCGAGANLTQAGSACSKAPDAGTPNTGPKATTVPCEYHDFDTGTDVKTCDAATQYCIRSYYASDDAPGANNVCVPLPTGCATCPCASDNAEAAWRKANNNTINCTNVTIACKDTNGAIVVDCVK